MRLPLFFWNKYTCDIPFVCPVDFLKTFFTESQGSVGFIHYTPTGFTHSDSCPLFGSTLFKINNFIIHVCDRVRQIVLLKGENIKINPKNLAFLVKKKLSFLQLFQEGPYYLNPRRPGQRRVTLSCCLGRRRKLIVEHRVNP